MLSRKHRTRALFSLAKKQQQSSRPNSHLPGSMGPSGLQDEPQTHCRYIQQLLSKGSHPILPNVHICSAQDIQVLASPELPQCLGWREMQQTHTSCLCRCQCSNTHQALDRINSSAALALSLSPSLVSMHFQALLRQCLIKSPEVHIEVCVLLAEAHMQLSLLTAAPFPSALLQSINTTYKLAAEIMFPSSGAFIIPNPFKKKNDGFFSLPINLDYIFLLSAFSL